MKVLVTGGFGNLGTLVATQLLGAGHVVTCLDLRTPGNERAARDFEGRVTVRWGDIRDLATVEETVVGQDAVIHLAAIIFPFSEADPERARQVNVVGTENVLRAVERSAAQPLLVFSSSFAVLGHRQKDPPPRTLADEVVATDHYSAHKIACERMITASEANWIILRLAGMVDSRMRHSHPEQMRLAFALAAANRIEYLHPNDAAVAFVHALGTPEAQRKVHLIGGGPGCQVTHLELMNVVLGTFGLTFAADEFGSQELYADWADTRESQRLLSYQSRSVEDFRRECSERFRWVRPFVRPLAPVVKWILKRYLARTG
ncbi:MAG: NAD(P)-dependent oxidoreductase [Deltaproteobacteria bacterium]|nr:NAD(P)-dependent oxidoreductase [Deltaproteobacteria bacterium]